MFSSIPVCFTLFLVCQAAFPLLPHCFLVFPFVLIHSQSALLISMSFFAPFSFLRLFYSFPAIYLLPSPFCSFILSVLLLTRTFCSFSCPRYSLFSPSFPVFPSFPLFPVFPCFPPASFCPVVCVHVSAYLSCACMYGACIS